MSGHREDGTYAEDKAHHENRRVSRDAILDRHIAREKAMWKGIDAAAIASRVSELDEEAGDRITYSQDKDIAPAHGIPRPQTSDFTSGPVVDGPNDYDLGSADAEDLREQSELNNERLKKGYY